MGPNEPAAAASANGPPLISVVMPVYNAASTIRNSIGSILAQTERDFELIVAFDPSSDGTDSILESLARTDNRIVLVRPEPNGTMPKIAALNAGLRHAKGRFIARMDADDFALPNRLAEQIAFLRRAPDVGICGTGIIIVDESGREIERLPGVTGTARLTILAGYSSPLFHPTWLMRREILDKVAGYRDMFAEDYDFLLRAMDLGIKLDNCPFYGVRYLRRPDHRALLEGHKAAVYAWRLHRRRQMGMPDGFSKEEHDAEVRAHRGPLERMGYLLMTKGFALVDEGNILGKLLLAASLILLPASRRLAYRKLVSSLKLALLASSEE